MIQHLSLSGLAALAFTTPAFAHAGHGQDGIVTIITHNFTQADHLVGILAAGILAVAVIAVALGRQRTSKTEVRAPRTTS
jgi:hydrogenase/urease accessory protein HupE